MCLRTTAEWETILLDIDVPHTAFAKLSDIADQPHLRAVDLFQEVEHPSEGTLLQARPPARFSQSPASVRRLAPRLGQHSREILIEAGFSEDEIDTIVSSGALGVGDPDP